MREFVQSILQQNPTISEEELYDAIVRKFNAIDPEEYRRLIAELRSSTIEINVGDGIQSGEKIG